MLKKEVKSWVGSPDLMISPYKISPYFLNVFTVGRRAGYVLECIRTRFLRTHRTQNTEYRIQNTEHRTQNTEHRTQNTQTTHHTPHVISSAVTQLLFRPPSTYSVQHPRKKFLCRQVVVTPLHTPHTTHPIIIIRYTWKRARKSFYPLTRWETKSCSKEN
jgi:hypothetical protein